MSYRVVWRERLLNSIRVFTFLRLEHGSGDDDYLDLAIIKIERRLSLDPVNEGESRGDTERVLIEPPLSVTFEPFVAERIVMIYDLILYPRMRG